MNLTLLPLQHVFCASTLSDMFSCVTGAIGTLRGPLHGGANEAAMDMN